MRGSALCADHATAAYLLTISHTQSANMTCSTGFPHRCRSGCRRTFSIRGDTSRAGGHSHRHHGRLAPPAQRPVADRASVGLHAATHVSCCLANCFDCWLGCFPPPAVHCVYCSCHFGCLPLQPRTLPQHCVHCFCVPVRICTHPIARP